MDFFYYGTTLAACKHMEFIVLNELDALGGRLAVGFT